MEWLLYGAYGFTGELVARRAVAEGERPILAGRDVARVRALAAELGLDHRIAALDDPHALGTALDGVGAVAHCAGPYSVTCAPMLEACLARGVHYLDLNGTIPVLEATFAHDARARAAGVAMVPGAGFDVVPTDCLIALTAARLPGASRIELAFRAGGGVSRGTATSAVEALGAASLARVGGAIVDAPPDRRRLAVVFGGRPVQLTAVSWGDVSTAFHSTGIGDVSVYTELPAAAAIAMRVAGVTVRVPGLHAATRWAASRAVRHMADPTSETMGATRAELWARATHPDGRTVTGRMTTPNTYALTADSVVRAVRRLADGSVPPGVHTPSGAFGADFAASLDGVTVTDDADWSGSR